MSDLLDASINGEWKIVKSLVREGVDINLQDVEYERTSLMYAVIDEEKEIVKLLLENGANPNLQDERGYTALHFASQDNLIDIAKLLLEHGTNTNTQDVDGNTPLFRAVFSSRGEGGLIKLLIRYGADKHFENNHGVSPFKLANTIANYDVLKFL
jgi:ankyrin repeat protein